MPIPNIIRNQPIDEAKYNRSKQLRKEMTPAESLLWSRLRRSQLDGLHARRQQIIRGFIADFYLHGAGLVIEVDGMSHDGKEIEDREREEIFQRLGFDVLRLRNDEGCGDIERVLNIIRARCRDRVNPPNPPAPFPEGKGEQRQ